MPTVPLSPGHSAHSSGLLPLLEHQRRHQCRHHQQIQKAHQTTQSGEHPQPHLGFEKKAQQQDNGEFQLQQQSLIEQAEQRSHDAKWMDGHSGKAGLGLGLLLGRLATGSDPGVSSLHVLMDISHGAGHGVHPRGDVNGIRVQLPPIVNPGMGAEGNLPDLVGRLNAVTTPHGQRTVTELGKVHGWQRPHLHRSRFPG